MQSIEQEQPARIQFDQKLLDKKKYLLDQLVKNQEDGQECLLEYPNPKLQQLAQQQLKEHGKLLLFRNTNSLYFGQTCNDLYHGQGLLIYKNSLLRFYEGQFQNNCKYGYGMQYINGDVFIGKFLNNKPQDQNGIFVWANGDIYHGGFISGMKHGVGKWQSGDQFFSGSWKFNKPEGEGYIKSALSEYHGDVKNGYKHGQGIELFNNGDRYEGAYSNGKPEGQGTYAWSNGSIYKGQFKNGLRFGFGIWQYGPQRYQGTYINDKRNGEGAYTWSGGSYYKGQFVEDVRHGLGEMHWDDQSFYKGEWNQGVQHGEGEIWEKGRMIQRGYFQNGKIKEEQEIEENPRKLAPLHQNHPKKIYSQRTTQEISSFQPKERFNSFHTRNGYYRPEGHQKKEKVFQQSYDKQTEALLEKRREINKRYSFLDRSMAQRRVSNQTRYPLKKSNQKSITKLQGVKFKQREVKASIAKIQLYKKLRKDKGGDAMNKKMNQTAKLPSASQQSASMFQNQLAPIKWTNFTHVGNH